MQTNSPVNRYLCLHCGSLLAADDVNASEETALCRKCHRSFRCSELVDTEFLASFDPANIPAGTSFEMREDGFVAEATTKSAKAWYLIPCTFLALFVVLEGIYGTQFRAGKLDWAKSLVGILFIPGTMSLCWDAVMSAFGRVIITRNGEEGWAFHGVGRLGRTWRFRWEDVVSVEQALRRGKKGLVTHFIRVVLRTPTRAPFEFGSLLSVERKRFVISVMRWQLARRAR